VLLLIGCVGIVVVVVVVVGIVVAVVVAVAIVLVPVVVLVRSHSDSRAQQHTARPIVQRSLSEAAVSSPRFGNVFPNVLGARDRLVLFQLREGTHHAVLSPNRIHVLRFKVQDPALLEGMSEDDSKRHGVRNLCMYVCMYVCMYGSWLVN